MLRLAHNNKPPLATLAQPSQGLVGHWTFQEGAGDRVHDRSGYNNTATLVGPAWVHAPGRGRVLDFDGSDDYVDVPARPEFNVGRADHYSVTGWFKTSNTLTTLRTFVEKRTTSGVTPFEMMVNNTHRFQIGTWNGSAAKIVVSTGTVNDGLWHFGAMVHSPDAAEGFLDGHSEGTYTGESGTTSNSENIRIGGDTSLSRYFPGQLDDLRIYNRALSSGEIMDLYRETTLRRQWLPRRRVLFSATVTPPAAIPASSVVTDIADAIVDKLNAASFGLSFTAVRKYAPHFRLRDMDTLHVTVVPSSETITQLSRTKRVHEYTIDVGVQKRFSSDALTTIDPLMDLVNEIADAFANASLSEFTAAAWVGTEIEPIFAPDHFTNFRQFTSVIRLMYRVHR